MLNPRYLCGRHTKDAGEFASSHDTPQHADGVLLIGVQPSPPWPVTRRRYERLANIYLRCYPFKVVGASISTIVVSVMNLMLRGGFTEERDCNKPMHSTTVLASIPEQRHLRVAVSIRRRSQDTGSLRPSPRSSVSVSRHTDTTDVRDLVTVLESNDRTPFFGGRLSAHRAYSSVSCGRVSQAPRPLNYTFGGAA